jgi:environmental stress-induced protein Ves
MTLQFFDSRSLPESAWKNGGGSTREILCWPPGAGLHDFDWRVSIATIESDGPFSTFPGVDRWISLLAGEGIHLATADAAVDHRLVEPLVPFRFDGGLPIACRRLNGTSQDFNVMNRRGSARIEIDIIRAATQWRGADMGVLLSVGGAWRCGDVDLPTGRGAWWSAPVGPLELRPIGADAALIAVRRELP